MEPRTSSYLVDDEAGRFFGPGPAELLARVRELGSLSAAAKAMDMSYTKAMRLVRAVEQVLGYAVTTRVIGGERGGSSQLTREGKELLRRYDRWRDVVSASSTEHFAAAFAGMAGVPRLGCVVMASGEARRFGSQKLLEPLSGRSVLSRTLDALPADRLDIVVVSRWPEVRRLCERRRIACAMSQGPLQSDTVRRGMEALGERAGYLFVQGDQPLLTGGSVDALLDEFIGHPHAVVRLAWHGRQGSPVLFPRELAGALSGLTGDVGGGEILRRNPDLAAFVRTVEAHAAVELDDIDTPADLERLERLCAGELDKNPSHERRSRS